MKYDFKDETVQSTGLRFPKLELKKDEVGRVCPLSPKFEATITHWVTKLGYVHCFAKADTWEQLVAIERDGGKPDECLLCEMALRADTKEIVQLPNKRMATYALRYKTDMRGNLLGGQLSYYLEIWLLGNKKFRELQNLRKEWGNLQNHDLEIICTEAKYQNFDITLKKEALWNKDKVVKQAVIEYFKAEAVKYDLRKCLGDEIDIDTLKRRFEVIRRRMSPEAEVGLSEQDMFSKETTKKEEEDVFAKAETEGNIFPAEEGEKVPEATTKEEKKETEESSVLDSLVP